MAIDHCGHGRPIAGRETPVVGHAYTRTCQMLNLSWKHVNSPGPRAICRRRSARGSETRNFTSHHMHDTALKSARERDC